MRRPHLGAAGGIALAASLALAACEGNADGARETETGPIKIGVIAERTGPVPVLGLVVDGMEAAVEYINNNGGVGGRPLELDVQDSAADPSKAVSLLRNFDAQDYDLVLGGAFGADCAAEGPAAERLSLVVLCLSTDTLPEQHSRMFGIGAPYEVWIAASAKELSAYGDRVGVFAEKAQGGDDVTKLVPGALAKYGVEAVIERTDPEATSYKSGVQRVITRDVDALWFTQCTPTVLAGVSDAQALGFTGPIMIGNCLASDDIAKALKANAEKRPGQIINMLPSLFAPEKSANAKQREAVDLYRKVVGKRDAVIADGWDSVWIAKQAIEAAGSTDGDALIKVFENDFTFEGVFHRGVWTADDHRGNDGVGLLVPVTADVDGTWSAK